ncbi:MAG: hypothetical protein K6V36_11450, partial [Anaerolineae bacterium]|nr:hypothetical protein [Anaerolineae bacterium]
MDSRTGAVRGPGAVVTFGGIRPQPEGAVHVGVSIYAAGLAAAGQTCVVERKDGAWVVTGTTGVR